MFATLSLSVRSRWGLLALVTVVALLGSLLAVLSPPAPARAEVTGSGGQYVPVESNARIYDGSTAVKSLQTVKVAGVNGLPTSGIGAISVMVTIADPNGQGQVTGRPDADDPNTLLMIYNAGVGGNTSNTGLLAVGDDGNIRIATETAQSRVILDVTGYYTSTANGASAGGFVPVNGTNIVDTRNGTGVRKGQLSGGDKITFQVAGANGVPAGAAAVAVSVVVANSGGGAGWVRPYPSDGAAGTGTLNYVSTQGVSTAMTAQVALGSTGKLTIDTAAKGGTIDVVVDVQGYFLPSNPGGGFTPQTGRLADTRSSGTVAANGSVAVQIAGARDGVPSVEGGLSAVAVTLTAIHSGTTRGYAKAYSDGSAEPNAGAINYGPSTSIRTTTTIVPVGANGKIRIKNVSTGATDFVVDLQGTYNSLRGGPADTNLTGQRKSATTLPFPITDQTNASVDLGTGNLLVTTSALSLPGVTQSTTIGAAYNSRSTTKGTSTTRDANRWQYALAGAGDLTANASGVVYTDAVGTAWQFKATTTQGAFTTPAGLQQTLTRVNTSGTNYEYQLKGWTTNQVIHFNLAGQPTSVVDRNGNQVSFNTSDGYALTTLVSTAGTTGARTATSMYANGVQTFTQTSGSSSRTVSWTKNSNGDITSYTDATGEQTTFGYTSGDLTSITAPEGGVTAFTYDSSDRVTKVEQRNTTAGSPGTAVTRLSYASDTSTQVADPRSDQSKAVADAKHTTYTLNSNDLVEKAVDAAGREQSREYNPSNNGVSAATTGVSGSAGASTTTGTYGANNKQSLTKVQGASGSSSSSTYSTGANAYRPADSTDSAGNSQQYTYSGVGNQLTTKSGSGDNAATAKLDYDDDLGFVTQATAPGNDGNPTKYTHDGSTHQLTTITPPTGTSLKAQAFTYDDFGRVKTQTDGRGNTTTFGYDNDDRTISIAFSDGTQTVTNTFDGNGNQTQQVSAGGTITNSYDQQNRLIATQNTAGGGQVQYSYDLAGNTATVVDAHGTVSHDYDPANALSSTTYPTSSGTAKQLYWTDDHGRRTDTWLAAIANADPTKDPTSWQAHQKLTYDKSGKVTRVQAWGNNADPQLVVDTTYCYLDGIAVGAACTATDGTNDRDQLQWSKDNITQQATDYDYTTKNTDGSTATTTRLQKATQAGGGKNTTWTYTYDAAGNRLTATASGDTTSSQTLTFNAVGQITSDGYTYDATGNMVAAPGATFTYNGAQQLTSSTKDGKKTAYTYAGATMNKLLAQSTDSGPVYRYTYGAGITSREVVGTGTASVITDPSTGQPLDLQTTDGTTTMWILNGIGNPVAAIADTGKTAYTTTYDPYGAETVTAGGDSAQWKQNPFGFKGGVRAGDANGLTKFGARWQSASTGGWIQRDTLDAPLDPSNANRYAYASDDPINGSDPTGRWVNASFNICAVVCGSVGRSQYGSDYSLTGSYGVSTSKGPGLSVSWGSGAPENDIGWSTDYSIGPLTASQNDSGNWSYSLDPTVTGLGVGLGRSYTATQQVRY